MAFLTASLLWLARAAGQVVFTDGRFLGTLAVEATAALLLLPFLRRRGWTPAAVAGAPEPLDVPRGGLVCLGAYAAYYLVVVTLLVLAPSWGTALQKARFAGGVSVSVAVAVAILNPLFEEFLWLGYGISALAPRIGLRAACFMSVALRVAVHAYQGPLALVGIAPLGIVFTWYYARTGRLWPVIVAHTIADAAALGAMAAAKH
jgi:membrane protease YdiL (CAAX protease family)